MSNAQQLAQQLLDGNENLKGFLARKKIDSTDAHLRRLGFPPVPGIPRLRSRHFVQSDGSVCTMTIGKKLGSPNLTEITIHVTKPNGADIFTDHLAIRFSNQNDPTAGLTTSPTKFWPVFEFLVNAAKTWRPAWITFLRKCDGIHVS
jgi:hypothetical protein